MEMHPVSENNHWTVQTLFGDDVDDPKMVLDCLEQDKINLIKRLILWPRQSQGAGDAGYA